MPTPPKTTRRKKPVCRQCGYRMAGHTRVEGSPICPQKSALASPPASPTPSRASASASAAQRPLVGPFVEFNFVPDPAFYTKMECGTLRRVNPNYVDKKAPITELLASPARSLVPTVLVDDDGNTIRGSNDGSTIRRLIYSGPGIDEEDDEDEDDEDEEGGEEEYYHQAMLDMRQPMLTIFRTKDKDLPYMQETALRMGVHYGVLTPPVTPPKDTKGVPSTPTQKSTRNTTQSSPAQENSMWFVMGQEASFVQEVVDSCQRGMPGTIAKDSELMEPFRATSFLQLVFAGVVGGCVVVCGLSLL